MLMSQKLYYFKDQILLEKIMNIFSFTRLLRIGAVCLTVGLSSALTSASYAQNIPTNELIKQMTGSGSVRNAPSRVNESRRKDNKNIASEELVNSSRAISAPTLKEFSPIELEYQNRAGQDTLRERLIASVQKARIAYAEGKSAGNEDDIRKMEQELLKQFGHELFEGSKSVSSTYLGRIQDSYIIGVGDELLITLLGNNSSSSMVAVDLEGNVVVDGLKPLSVAGRTFGDVRQELSKQVKSSMVGTELYLSMGGLRRVNVQVLGQVKQPGTIVVDSSSDLLAVLIKSGGINKAGSLRRVKIVSKGKTRTVDLYDVLLGKAVDLSVSDGARIIVPLIGKTVALEGKILRPGIYELAEGQALSLQDLLNLGGGILRPGGNLYRRSFVSEDGRIKLASLSNKKSEMKAGDLISVYYESWRPERGVGASGHVRSAQTFILEDKPTIAALLKKGEMLKDNAYPYFSVLRRQDRITGKFNYQALNLAPIISGVHDVDLAEGDELIVLSESDIRFLNSKTLRNALMYVKPVYKAKPQRDENSLDYQNESQAEPQSELQDQTEVCMSIQPLIKERGSSRFDRVTTLYGASSSPIMDESDITEDCAEIFEDKELLLPFVLEHVVALQGAVRNSGLFPVVENVSVGELISFAGGLIKNADLSHVDGTIVTNESGLSIERRMYDFTTTSMFAVAVEAGSRFTFHANNYDLEVGSILLQGEVKRPGRYAIMRGDTLSSVIKRAGGLTDNAYPYGSVFTRTRVREQQQEHMRKAVRDVRSALAYAALKKENVEINDSIISLLMVEPDQVEIDVLGRMVVEADPDVLEARSELDVIVEPDDILFVPSRPSYVLLAGDVVNAGALQFDASKTVSDYLSQAGGLQVTADDDRIYVVYPNGIAEPIRRSFWSKANITLTPGTTIVVPKNLSPIDGLTIAREVTSILSQMAVSVASLAIITR